MLIRPTIEELHAKILENIGNEYDKTVGYITHDMTKTFAIEETKAYEAINKVYDGIDVEKISGDDLERFIYQRKGISRKQATFSEGLLNVTGNGSIKIGDVFETEAGTQFKAIENKTITTSGVVKIRSILAGQIGNVASGTIAKMPITITGIEKITNQDPTVGGYEAESDASLLDRYYLALRTPPTSGNKYHYLQWALEVEGVGDAKVYPLDKGTNTVTVVIIDAEKQPPTDELIQKVQDHIDPNSEGIGEGQAPIGAMCYVEGATGVAVNIALSITVASGYTNKIVQQGIKTNIANHLKEIAFKQTYLSYAKVGAIILDTDGVADYANLTINGTTGNINIEDRQVLTLGGVIIA